MSLYAEYAKERLGQFCIENADGFCTYVISPPEVFIADCYVVPHKRKTRLASQMVDQACEAAKTSGCKILTCCVDTKTQIAAESMKAILGYGFKVLRSTESAVYFYKEIG